MQQNSSHTVRFAAFELDLEAGELRRSGVRLPVQGRPLQVLTILLRNSFPERFDSAGYAAGFSSIGTSL
jgi:hypothetical protein